MNKSNPANLSHYTVHDVTVNDVEQHSEEKKEQRFLDRQLNSTPPSTKGSQPVIVESERKPTAYLHK